MHAIFESTKEFDLEVGSTDTDVSLIQECVAEATQYQELSDYWSEAIALTLSMMDARQRDWFRFERMYPEAIAIAVFGDGEDNPIIIADDDL